MAALLAAMAYATFLATALSVLGHRTALERSIDVAHDLTGLVLGLSLWLVASTRAVRDAMVLRIALAVQVLIALAISIAVPWAGFIRTAHLTSVTWVVPLIILAPLLVPTRPATTLAVSILCALTMPAGLLLLAARGLITVAPGDVARACVTGAVTVAIATLAARTVYGARQQIVAARLTGSSTAERLGAGGMGEVWKARHLMLARPAAVKLILPHALQGPLEAREQMNRRFTHEAQATAGLCSPHTVKLFDFGSASDDALYYAMELLDGITVERFVFEYEPVEPRRAVHWLRQVCHSLGEAHTRETPLIHRDIKPANLFVCRYGRDLDFIKVLDFGLSRPTVRPENASLTRHGEIRHAGHMAPEQVCGSPPMRAPISTCAGLRGLLVARGLPPVRGRRLAGLRRVDAPPPPLPISSLHPITPQLERATGVSSRRSLPGRRAPMRSISPRCATHSTAKRGRSATRRTAGGTPAAAMRASLGGSSADWARADAPHHTPLAPRCAWRAPRCDRIEPAARRPPGSGATPPTRCSPTAAGRGRRRSAGPRRGAEQAAQLGSIAASAGARHDQVCLPPAAGHGPRLRGPAAVPGSSPGAPGAIDCADRTSAAGNAVRFATPSSSITRPRGRDA
jgi:serine/threonine-protein kinase